MNRRCKEVNIRTNIHKHVDIFRQPLKEATLSGVDTAWWHMEKPRVARAPSWSGQAEH